MILPDYRIIHKGEELISPFKQENVQPASVDLTLAGDFITFRPSPNPIDLADLKGSLDDSQYQHHLHSDSSHFMLSPGAFVLGSTAETIKMPPTLVGRVEGKSSLGRLGLMVHSTAGFIDPGFEGKITLEFSNLNNRWIMLRPGLRVCQISFDSMAGLPHKPYGTKGLNSKYQGQVDTTPSRYQG